MQTRYKLCLLALVVVVTAAPGGRPHFLRAPSASLGSPKVIVDWTEVGLGNTQNGITYVASAKAGAHFQCVKRGHVCPKPGAKEEVLKNVYVSGTFTIDKNGRISNTLTIPAPESSLVCPYGQSVTLVSVVFTNITLKDTTNGLTAPANPSSLSYSTTGCPDY
ncbi:hypothetical protein LF41_2647 [Lysobacter dokdonensis DS-58]|uniref:Secreted protein n=1 Tax=Lysobacter dokdonensis DS-58 TaxID=1300345 RepID=A0A0A2X3D3_9GAMM|nr:hypothetical protein [Lysobacter dokdonensis]KGQ19709.1 hypothetical protein LF41_2647 [Lysobacter dokdonensis DS-58]